MKFSFHLPVDKVRQPAEFLTADAVAEMARGLEAAGINAGFVTDHPAPADPWLASGGHHALDPFVALSFAAASTTRLRLHANLIVLAYRNPFMTAKSVASLDVLSGGRLILGVGSGYLEGEFKAVGASFAGRGAAMDEALAVMKQVWTGQSVKVTGRNFDAEGNTALPVPAQHPHPPIWVGGNSGKAIRRAVESAQGWSPFPVKGKMSQRVHTDEIVSIDDLRRKIGEARQLAREIGRTEPLDVCMVPFGMTMHAGQRPEPALVIDQMAELAEAGVTWAPIAFPCETRRDYLANVEWFATHILPAVK